MEPLAKLRARLDKDGIPAMLVTEPVNVAWLTGFRGSFGRVVVTADSAVFITDSRYTLQAQEQVLSMPTEWFGTPTDADVFTAQHAKALGATKLGFESGTTTYAQWKRWTEKMDGIELLPLGDIFGDLRMVKSAEEILKIKAACGVADAAYAHIVRMIQPGVTEIDICLDLEFFMRRQGADIAFPSIIVSGHRSARPHGVPSDKKLEVGDFVTMDFGANLDGYNSDITRTVVVGAATARHREVYGAVLEAQLWAIDALRPGAKAKDVDLGARAVLEKYGLAKYFGHGLGHGLGRLVHDSGRLSSLSEHTIEPGQIWTIEPGVYIEGFGGVRIEDDVLITEDGNEILTHSPKDLAVLPLE